MTLPMTSRRIAVAGAALVLAAVGLAAAGCGDSGTGSGSGGGEGTATLPLRDGGGYTVTLAPGQAEAIDIFANSGGEPVSIWGAPGGTDIPATVGAAFAIGLIQSGGTGYTWKATGGTAPGSVVALVQDWVLQEDSGPGSPGTHYFVYRGTAAGTGTLEFSQYPPGRDKASKTDTYTVTVTK